MAAAATNTCLPILLGRVGLGTLLAHGLHRCPARLVAGVHLGVAGPDGQAGGGARGRLTHVAPVWVDLDGDQVVFTTSADTIKGKAILRDPRVSLCWDDERPPVQFRDCRRDRGNVSGCR